MSSTESPGSPTTSAVQGLLTCGPSSPAVPDPDECEAGTRSTRFIWSRLAQPSSGSCCSPAGSTGPACFVPALEEEDSSLTGPLPTGDVTNDSPLSSSTGSRLQRPYGAPPRLHLPTAMGSSRTRGGDQIPDRRQLIFGLASTFTSTHFNLFNKHCSAAASRPRVRAQQINSLKTLMSISSTVTTPAVPPGGKLQFFPGWGWWG